MRVTIVDVAREAGTSTASVSKVLRNRRYVSDETRTRVLQAIDRLGYRPNRAAQSLVQGKAHAIGIAISDIRNPFYPGLIRAIDDAARAAGDVTITIEVDFSTPDGMDHLGAFADGLVDGVVFASWSGAAESLKQLADRSVPLAFVTCRPADPSFDYVVVDDHLGTELAVEHLVRLGHRRIAHVTSPEADWGTQRRLSSFIGSVRAHGLEVDERLIVTAERRNDESFFGRLDGYTAALALMREAEPPTAVFCADDLIALGAMQAIEESGARIPKDVSLIGFDNISLSALPRISLTTIAQPIERMGQLVARHVMGRVGGSAALAPFQVMVEPYLIARASTGAAPRRRRTGRGSERGATTV